MPKNDQIYSVTMTWYMKSERKWTHPCIIDYLKIEDGDLERVSRIIAKDYGNLEEGWLQIKDGMARFGIKLLFLTYNYQKMLQLEVTLFITVLELNRRISQGITTESSF